ncbi:MAG: diaminopimelate decarboxylase [Verrucomicrobia bacterium]|nr:MAG: diaminopimelate decarboxylase [Verrucomicrobiota bacterium]
MNTHLETLRTLDPSTAGRIRDLVGTPAYVYDEKTLVARAHETLAFPNAFGLTVRYAMKACPNGNILRIFDREGLHVDASSVWEVERAVRAGIEPDRISLSTQELAPGFEDWVRRGVKVNACSLDQIDRYGRAFPGGEIGLRLNPGLGSGGTTKTNVGGPASSFGIWHETLDEADVILRKHGSVVVRIHSHIGSGSDPAVWISAASLTLAHVRRYETVCSFNLGGGFKVARMSGETGTDLQLVGQPVRELLEGFARETGRELHFEIEPGTYLTANAGAVLTTVQDISTTGEEGYAFIKLDAGMTELTRPSLYGSQHPMILIPADGDERRGSASYVAVGHCCESGDMLTPREGDPSVLDPRMMIRAQIGDLLVIEGAGAYCSAMATKNYNSFPEAPEVLIRANGEAAVIRRRQTLDQIIVNEETVV